MTAQPPTSPLCSARAQFLDSLAGRLLRLVDILERWRRARPAIAGDADLLLARRELHTLSGTAGTLGFAAVTAAAAALYRLLGNAVELRDVPAPDTIDNALGALLATAIDARLEPEAIATPPVGNQPRKRVVVVDDETDLLAVTCARLCTAGYIVSPFDNGECALSALDRLVPDIMVIDWNMPAMEGAALLQRICLLPQFRRVPVIVYSACDSPAEQAQMRALGADDTVSKLAAPDALVLAIERHLQGRTGTDAGAG